MSEYKDLRKKNPKKDRETAGQYRLRIQGIMNRLAEERPPGKKRPHRKVILQADAPVKGGRPPPWAGAKK